MEFRILGPLELSLEGRVLPLPANKPRALLAVLLLHRGEAVSLDGLADCLWGEQPPATAAKSTQVYVSQLRKLLGEGVLETRGRGYALAVDPERIDAVRFERMLEESIDARARGRAREAAETLRGALSLWRGPALADFAYESWAQPEIARLENLRVAALEERIESDLELGRHDTLIAEIEGLVERHPTRERLCGYLMLALYRSGRQSEALEVFRERRRRIVEELGLEPGPALRELEAAILRQDPSLDAPARPARALTGRRRPSGRRLAALAGAALAAVGAGLALNRSDQAPATASLVALPESICSPLAYEPGTRPTRLVISDQELSGDLRILGSQITAAVEFVLRERNFAAGPHTLAFQACDSFSGDRDEKGCGIRAKRYAANPALVGVIGPLRSFCAADVIPATNSAPGGPLAVVSSSNTGVFLTRGGMDALPSEPASLYPTGVRNYVRVIAADDFQVAASAMLARQLGLKRPLVIFDGDESEGKARVFRSAAAKLGLDAPGLVRREQVDGALIARIKQEDVDAVFLPGGNAVLVDELRGALGPRFPILATDAFSAPDAARAIGPASEGLLLTAPGVDPRGVKGAGRDLVDRLREAVGEPHPYAVSAVAATELLLDAIARSDGTRRAVISELFASEVRGGVLGKFSITPTGDTTANQVTIYRIKDGQPQFDRVLTPPLSLVVSSQ